MGCKRIALDIWEDEGSEDVVSGLGERTYTMLATRLKLVSMRLVELTGDDRTWDDFVYGTVQLLRM